MADAAPKRASGGRKGKKKGRRGGTSENVKVVVRLRPLFEGEGDLPAVRVDPVTNQVLCFRSEAVAAQAAADGGAIRNEDDLAVRTFDAVFGPESTQQGFFEAAVREAVGVCLEGYNSTVLAYGQSGSGKTHTMMGVDRVDSAGRSLRGVIPNVFAHIFGVVEDAPASVSFMLRVHYAEVYKEDVRDLLSSNYERKLKVQQTGDGVVIRGLSQHAIASPADVTRLIAAGSRHRRVGTTDLNDQSSRSHAIFTVIIECSETDDATGRTTTRTGKLNLVDLAGSERFDLAHSSGEQYDEMVKINQSLMSLNRVMTALVRGASYVPYRDSILTRVLKDSLGGDSKTVMVATISPAVSSITDTLKTVHYASQAKKIKNAPRVHATTVDAFGRSPTGTAGVSTEAAPTPGEAAARAALAEQEALVAKYEAEMEALRAQVADAQTAVEAQESTTEVRLRAEAEAREAMGEALASRAAELEEAERERALLQARIKAMKKKVLAGGTRVRTDADAEQHKRAVDEAVAARLRVEEERHRRELEANHSEFAAQQKQLGRLQRKYAEAKRKLAEAEEHIAIMGDEASLEIEALQRNVKRLEMIVSSFVPPEEEAKITARMVWSAASGEYRVAHAKMAGNHCRRIPRPVSRPSSGIAARRPVSRVARERAHVNPARYRPDNILDLALDYDYADSTASARGLRGRRAPAESTRMTLPDVYHRYQ